MNEIELLKAVIGYTRIGFRDGCSHLHLQETMSFCSLFSDLSSPHLLVACAGIASLQGAIFPEEWSDIQNAHPKRRREFIAGRRVARQLSQSLGFPDYPLRRSAQRTPLWRHGATGSISHSATICVAAVARKAVIPALGIDIEALGRVKPKLWGLIFTASEQERLYALSTTEARLAATVMFSAKESFYKLQYSITGNWVGFHDVEVRLIDESRCRIAPVSSQPDVWHQPDIHVERVGPDHVATFMQMK